MKHVVALSGGKDSTALALRLAEMNPGTEYAYLTTQTGNEPAEVKVHLDNLERLLGRPIERLKADFDYRGDGLLEVARREGMIPNFRSRFCTRILKIEPTLAWLEANAPVVHYVGLRADEPLRDGIYGSVEGVEHRYPMRDWGWGLPDVLDYLEQRGVTVPRRTDCKLCFWQTLPEWKRLWKRDPEGYAEGVELEAELEHTFRSPKRDTWPAGLAELGRAFASGRRVPGYTEDVQLRLFQNCDMDDACRVCSL